MFSYRLRIDTKPFSREKRKKIKGSFLSCLLNITRFSGIIEYKEKREERTHEEKTIWNIAFPAPVKAVPQKYMIPEAGVSFAMPSGYDAFYRDMKENDPLFSKYNITKESLMITFDNGVFLSALNSDGEEEIMVTMEQSTSLDELNGLGETTLMILASAIKEKYEENGVSVSDYDVYHHPQLDFIRISYQATDDSFYGVQYYTICNNVILNYYLYSYDGPVSKAQNKAIQSVVDSIQLQSHTPATMPTESEEETPAFLYTDEETGTTFMVPEGWTEESPSKEWDYINVRFSYAGDPVRQIMYGSQDVSGELSAMEWAILDTQESAEEICDGLAEGMGIPRSAVNKQTYHGADYFLVEAPKTSEEYGITVNFTQAMRIEDGRVYLFQVTGTRDSWAFAELEKLLESVEYPETAKAGESAGAGKRRDSFSDQVIVNLFAGFFAFLLAALYAIIKKSRRDKKAKKEAIGTSEYVFCRSCGKRFPAGTRFCDVCGEKLK